MIDRTKPPHETTDAPLSDREWKLADLLCRARTALWREWVETGSMEAKSAFEATDPKDVA